MPKEKVIWDRVGTRIGTLTEAGNEVVVGNRLGSRLGHFDKRTNSTRDRHGNRIGEGNTTASLVVDDWKQR
jgi:hypothetical protein